MKLEKDLLVQKSTTKTVLGFLILLLITLWITTKIYTNVALETFDWIYLCSLVALSILFIFEGIGIPFAKIFGKAFILIDEERICMKKGVCNKEQNILWREIKQIEYKPNQFVFTKQDNSVFPLRLRDINYNFNKEILECIKTIGKEKGLKIKRLKEPK